jgi:hypothetical protein
MEPTTAKVATEAAKELGITQLVPAIYQDLLQPAVKETGQRFVVVARAVAIGLAPLEGAVWGYQQIKDYLSAAVAARLANKPAEEIKPPDRVIAGPVVMSMAFAAEAPHLREMYANLLAAAMHAPSANRVHPSFVQVIQQLAPAEAQILEEIARSYTSGSVLFREDLVALESSTDRRSSVLRFLLSTQKTHISSMWLDLCGKCGVSEAALAHAFYRNLVRLGILAERIESLGEEARLGERLFGGQGGKRLSSYVELTEYGDLFLDVCVRDK